MRSSPRPIALSIASGLLGVGVLIALVLITLLVVRPPGEMEVAVGGQQPTTCPPGSGAPACFRFDVTNTGERPGTAACIATPEPGTEASFLNGSRVAEVPLSAGEVQQVYVKVTPEDGTDTVFAPYVVCNPR
jgi:hypothetical protein